jgi:amino acid transporter
METSTDGFDLHQTIETVWQAAKSVFSHMLFDFALHGFILALILALLASVFLKRKSPYGLPIVRVAKRITIFCLIFSLPGSLYLIMHHHLPDAGVFSFNSIGLIGFWSLICTHLVAEEINNSIIKKGIEKPKVQVRG